MLLIDLLGVIGLMLMKRKLLTLAYFIQRELNFFAEVRWYTTSLLMLINSVGVLLLAAVLPDYHYLYDYLVIAGISGTVFSCCLTPCQFKGCLKTVGSWLKS